MEAIFGQLQGLKSSQLKQLRRLYHQRVPPNCVVTPELTQRLAAVSADLQESVCLYLNRRGQVVRVGVGTPMQTQIPPLDLPRYGAERLSGIRCIATTLKVQPPKESDLAAMALQRLDVMALVTLSGSGFERRGGGATGYVGQVYLAHLTAQPDAPWTVSVAQSLDWLAEQDFLALVDEIEAAFAKLAMRLPHADTAGGDRVLAVSLVSQDSSDPQAQRILAEVQRLVESAGGTVLEAVQQKRSHPHPQTVIGAGKVREVALKVQTLGANLVVFDRDLSPVQIRNLEAQLGVRVVDRTEVILDIFAQRAQTRAGKLQVELAQLEYLLPRLTGRGQAMSRLGGGIGTRGPGETQLETERRTIQRRLNRLQKEVDHLQAHRSRLRQKRQNQGVPSIAVVGYTNAGKSTLLNVLTNAEVYTADQLFATLDPTTRRLNLTADQADQDLHSLVLVDTVGFIHELPPSLLDAFRATLEEVTEADGLLHVVDLSHPAWREHIESVEQILAEMPTVPGPALLVFNKIDQVDSSSLELAKRLFPQAVFIAAQERLGLSTLRQRLVQLVTYVTS
ncbi:GTPase HflX [Lyngbya confervoides BDU141951]|uniref:GTPase HflX n=2 Tax=Lyngbya TaxID=28073 RepID=A0ABD4T6K4_9CYAN|nr:GTPase HflX [Lyngbya confervoides]MCM1984271.1 GTPase HflX [Lyngbya confervoides BDU141951]